MTRHLVRAGVGGALWMVLAACSSEEPAPPGEPALRGAEAEEGADLHGDHQGSLDASAPSDDPVVDVDDEADGNGDTLPGDAAAKPSGGNCVKGGLYCGGDKVTGDSKTLYECKGPGEPAVVEKCANGCLVNAGVNDACAPAAGAKVPSPVVGRKVTYPYGVKNPRYAAGYHTGEDYAAPTGSNAVAVRNGTVRWSNDNGGSYGKWIGLEADNGRTYVYCHLSKRLVTSGTKVVAGQLLAKTGATGNVTGPHLHFEDHPKGPFVYGQVRKPAW